MLNLAVRNTRKLIREKAKEENVRIGRFFTAKETAALMASFFTVPKTDSLRILDPGAGTGILSAALIEAICRRGEAKEITLVCYENDALFLPVLEKNLGRLRQKCRREYGVTLAFRIREENFVLSKHDQYSLSLFATEEEPFDLVIMNPPSAPLQPKAPEYCALENTCHGVSDMAFAFAAMAFFSLKEGGQLVASLPVSYADSVNLAPLRARLMREGYIERVHAFFRKSKDAYRPNEAKGSLLIKLVKAPLPADFKILLSSSFGKGKEVTLLRPMPYADIVNGESGAIVLPESEVDIAILSLVRSFPENLGSLHLRMRTGLTLESRYPTALRSAPGEGAIPLICPADLDNGTVRHSGKKYIVPVIPSLAQPNRNMILLKRVPAKKDKRHLYCGIYFSSQLPHFRYISTSNKLNYIERTDGNELDSPLLYGLYAILSSDLYERYCTLLSKSPQINAKSYADLPLPEEKLLREIGNRLLTSRLLTPGICNSTVNKVLRLEK
ncbi:MAG: hypothetical protein IJY71_01640 [Clostridia bacterium]|nr:hypothetical protein [Clostridia bacterium]